jgi:4-hydroxybenzoate polyprenyltransferase
VNDIMDRRLDSLVERTRYRPLASGVMSVPAAATFAACQAAAGLALLMQLNDHTIALGFAAVPLVCTYPMMKRVTHLVRAAGTDVALVHAANLNVLGHM